MSSRQEQKERRKREREERLKREKQVEQRKRLGQIIGGVAIVAAMVVAIVLVASNTGGGSGTTGEAADRAPDGLPIPEFRTTNLPQATKLAKCAYTDEFPDEGSEHVEGAKTAKDFKTNPPTSGDHSQTPAEDGYYARGQQPPLENILHTMEHGRVVFQYGAKLPEDDERRLRTLFNEDISGAGQAYHAVLMQNNSSMPYLIAATAWRSSIRCNQVNQFTWDALRAFYREKLDQGPEQVP